MGMESINLTGYVRNWKTRQAQIGVKRAIVDAYSKILVRLAPGYQHNIAGISTVSAGRCNTILFQVPTIV